MPFMRRRGRIHRRIQKIEGFLHDAAAVRWWCRVRSPAEPRSLSYARSPKHEFSALR